MNYYEISVIALMILNFGLIFWVGTILVNKLDDFDENIGKLLAETLPEVIKNQAENMLPLDENVNPLQQLVMEWIRGQMNKPQVEAKIIDRDVDGKFSTLEP